MVSSYETKSQVLNLLATFDVLFEEKGLNFKLVKTSPNSSIASYCIDSGYELFREGRTTGIFLWSMLPNPPGLYIETRNPKLKHNLKLYTSWSGDLILATCADVNIYPHWNSQPRIWEDTNGELLTPFARLLPKLGKFLPENAFLKKPSGVLAQLMQGKQNKPLPPIIDTFNSEVELE